MNLSRMLLPKLKRNIMIKVVSFDIGGTLLRDNNEDAATYSIKALTNLVDKDKDLVRDAYKDIFQKTKGTFEELVNAFCEKLNIKVTKELTEFFKHKFDVLDEQISVSDLELLKEIKDKGYKVILFSNNCCLVKSTIKDSLKDIVDGIYYSFDLGYTKSDKESYQYIEKELNCKPEEFLHIGDTLKSDYLKPISFGWNALFYGTSDDDTIKCITDLKDIFKYLN